MFTPSNLLQRYLNTHPRDMHDIIGALMGYINADPAFRTNDFEEAIKYVLDQGISEAELFKEFNSEYALEEDKSKWDNDYYSYARVDLKDNFCRKRIEHVKAVARKLYPMEISDTPVRSEKSFCQIESGLESEQKLQKKRGQQESGKKSKGQTNQRKITKKPICVKIIVFLMILGVVLALLIVYTLRSGNYPVVKKLSFVSGGMTSVNNEMNREESLG